MISSQYLAWYEQEEWEAGKSLAVEIQSAYGEKLHLRILFSPYFEAVYQKKNIGISVGI